MKQMIKLTPEQRKKLEAMWFTFGNNGKKHTWGNHKWIQGILERGEDDRNFFKRAPERMPSWLPISSECEQEVDKVLA
jgi:hypothetical protein